ncbi:hypothetical protein BH11ACT2_BH11ACT2_09520 [soil metagenome]
MREAREAGVTPDRLRSADLDAPFHGVRTRGVDLTLVENRCRAYLTLMSSEAYFSHTTAAMLWGIPLLRGLPIVSPAAAWADVAESLGVDDLVAAGEAAITGNPIRDRPPIASLEELAAIAQQRRGTAGARARAQALRLMKNGALSRPESLTRLLLVRAGVPHPLINPSIFDDRGAFVAMPDLAWPEYKVALEYEGDHHREVKRYRTDIARVERLVDHGWLVVKVSADDLFDEPRALVERVVRRLVSRGWTPGRIHLAQIGHYQR